jgi:hypothetical protein
VNQWKYESLEKPALTTRTENRGSKVSSLVFQFSTTQEHITMIDSHQNHQEDHTVCYRVALFFVFVIASITVIAFIN